MRISSLKFQRNFNNQTLFCISFAKNLASSYYWNLYWIIQLWAMWSYYWDEITDRITKCLSYVLMSYQWEIEFCYCGSKIRDLIRNLQQNRMSFCSTINMCTINLFAFSNLIALPGFLGFLIGRKAPSFISKSQHALGTRLHV